MNYQQYYDLCVRCNIQYSYMIQEIEAKKYKIQSEQMRELSLSDSAFLYKSVLMQAKDPIEEQEQIRQCNLNRKQQNNKIKVVYRMQESVKKRRKNIVKNSLQKIVSSNKQAVKQTQIKRYDEMNKQQIKTYRSGSISIHQTKQIKKAYAWQSIVKKTPQFQQRFPSYFTKNNKSSIDDAKIVQVREIYARKQSFKELQSIKSTQAVNTISKNIAENTSCDLKNIQILQKTKFTEKKKSNGVECTSPKASSRYNYRAAKHQKRSLHKNSVIEAKKNPNFDEDKKQTKILKNEGNKMTKIQKNFQMYEKKSKKNVHKQFKASPSFHGTYVNDLIKKHKAQNAGQIQKRLRSTLSRGIGQFQKYVSIQQYNVKCGNPKNSKIFVFNSQDEYIRKVLLEWGWIQNKSVQSPFFNLKWTYMPTVTENCKFIQDFQTENHFKNSHQLTSKSYLSKNLKLSQYFCGKCDNFYPKCFDIGKSSQCQEFIQQYRHNLMMNLLNKIYQYCMQKSAQIVEKYSLFYKYHFKRDLYAQDPHSYMKYKRKSIFIKKQNSSQQMVFRKILFENYKCMNQQFCLNINLIFEALKYWRNYRKKLQQQPLNKQRIKNRKLSPKRKLDSQAHALSFDKIKFLQNFKNFNIYLQSDVSKPLLFEKNFQKQMYATPSELLIERICKEYVFCLFVGAIKCSYGDKNIWIVKPSSTSRGNGIFLTNSLSDVLTSSKNIQSRIVQKYIQRPLIIKNQKYPLLNGKKFDIRQWVLLKSVQPLEIYMFSHCYLRICYSKYPNQLDPLSEWHLADTSKHLTNYSVNKNKYGIQKANQSVVSIDYLSQILKTQYSYDWQIMKQKIKDIIINSVQSCREALDETNSVSNDFIQYSSSSVNNFQLLGYDILIDQQFNPWLLEVNMSPACEQRTKWLSQYLKQMGKGLLQLVLPQNLIGQSQLNTLPNTQRYDQIQIESPQIDDKDPYLFLKSLFVDQSSQQILESHKKQIQYSSICKWQLIYNQPKIQKKKQINDIKLQIVGNSVNLQYEKGIDEGLQADRAARIIQKFMKNYIPRYKQYIKKCKQKQKVIQVYTKSCVEFNNYSIMKNKYYLQKISRYLLGFCKYQETHINLKNKFGNKINQYLRSAQQSDCKFSTKLTQFRTRNFLNVLNEVKMLRSYNMQARQFSVSLTKITLNVIFVQSHIKKYVEKSKQKKLTLFKYLKTFYNTQVSYPLKYYQYQRNNKLEVIERSFKGYLSAQQTKKKNRIQNTLQLKKYCAGLINRQQWFKRRLQIFDYIVSRIYRVKKRKIRGQILLEWKKQALLKDMILHKKCVHRYLKGAMVATKFNEDKLYYFRNRKEK